MRLPRLRIWHFMAVVAITALGIVAYLHIAEDIYWHDSYVQIGDRTFSDGSPVFWLVLAIPVALLVGMVMAFVWVVKARRRRKAAAENHPSVAMDQVTRASRGPAGGDRASGRG